MGLFFKKEKFKKVPEPRIISRSSVEEEEYEEPEENYEEGEEESEMDYEKPEPEPRKVTKPNTKRKQSTEKEEGMTEEELRKILVEDRQWILDINRRLTILELKDMGR